MLFFYQEADPTKGKTQDEQRYEDQYASRRNPF